MQELTMNVNWIAVVVGAVLAFGLGMFWYSPMMFGKSWSAGVKAGEPSGMAAAMVLQAWVHSHWRGWWA